jgi:biopolymer transport protein TolQ
MLGRSGSILSMALTSGPVVGGVLLLLVACSVGCWSVIVYKFGVIRRASREDREFLKIFWESSTFQAAMSRTEHLQDSPIAEVFRIGYGEWRRGKNATEGKSDDSDLSSRPRGIEDVERTLRQAASNEKLRLQSKLIFLATVASAAPFVGLFGTVWGIMNSFRDIGVTGSANLAVVAPGISEALIATATGLAAAIPAVVAYNYFNNSIRMLSTRTDEFVTEFLNIVSRSRRAAKP